MSFRRLVRLGATLRLFLMAVTVVLAGGMLAVSGHAQTLPPTEGSVQNFIYRLPHQPMPDVVFLDAADETRSLKDFEGKVILLNFWATWCAPCREEMPSIDRLQAELGGPDFVVLPLSIDRGGKVQAIPGLERWGVEHLTSYFDPSMRSMRAVAAAGLPTTILIGRDGREIGRLTGPAEWDTPEAKALIRHFMAEDRLPEAIQTSG